MNAEPPDRSDVPRSSAELRDEELRYLVAQLARRHPDLAGVLMTGRAEGRSWADVYDAMILKLKEIRGNRRLG